LEVQVLSGLRPRSNRFAQPSLSSDVLTEAQARDFALELLNDLVSRSGTRSSAWDAQVELLTRIVQSTQSTSRHEATQSTSRHEASRLGDERPGGEQFDAATRQLEDARGSPSPAPSPGTPFVPMS
jgi:hypothetical protein